MINKHFCGAKVGGKKKKYWENMLIMKNFCFEQKYK